MMAQASMPYEHPGLRVEFEKSPRAAGTVWYLSHKNNGGGDAVYVLYDALAGAQWLGDGRVSVKDLRPPPLGGVQVGDRLLVPGQGIVEVTHQDRHDHTVSVRRLSTGLAHDAAALEDKELDFGYSCFGPDGADGVRFRGECLWKGGTWDARCRRDEECPFFQANLRYPNYHGGCHNGYCEMPLGVTRVGYTRYTGMPVCYDDDCTQGGGGVAFSGVPSLESAP
jgi:hypothetical protein